MNVFPCEPKITFCCLVAVTEKTTKQLQSTSTDTDGNLNDTSTTAHDRKEHKENLAGCEPANEKI